MALIPQPLSRFNLSNSSILLLQSSGAEMDLYVQMLCGFGATVLHRCVNQEEAKAVLQRNEIDLAVIDAKLADGDGYEFVRQLRRSGVRSSFVPVLMIAGHTPRAKVAMARDCGSHFICRKPLSPGLLLERILWIAQECRPVIEADAYVGPDRRFQNLGPPEGEGRRKTDLSADVGEASGPDLDQDEVNKLFKPQRAKA